MGTDPDLRILILSTPKTGNTWLRHLLAGVYRLPQYYVPPPLDCAKLDRAGPRWVTHYHAKPSPELLNWIRLNRAVVITTIRHPADVLISLYHHVHEFRSETIDQEFIRRMLSTGFTRRGITTYAADRPFSADLDCSLEWMACDGTHVVRYEDLQADPCAALRKLTARIHPAPEERIAAAVEMCRIGVMRRMAGQFSPFFREGTSGGWRGKLTPDIVEILRSRHPYAAQMEQLGYSMDAPDAVPMRCAAEPHAMTTLSRFENGAGVAPMLVQSFFWAPSEQRAAWERRLAATGPGSFYAWLNTPAPVPAQGIYESLRLSNIAAFVYDQRPDVRMVYKDLTSGDRYEFVRWFVRRAAKEMGLDAAFVNRQRTYLLGWANARQPVGSEQVSNLVAHICLGRVDILPWFPLVTGANRRALVREMVRAAKAMKMDPEYIRPLEESLGRHWLPRRVRQWCGVAE